MGWIQIIYLELNSIFKNVNTFIDQMLSYFYFKNETPNIILDVFCCNKYKLAFNVSKAEPVLVSEGITFDNLSDLKGGVILFNQKNL